MIVFSEEKDVSSEKNIIRLFFDFSSESVAEPDLAKTVAIRINEIISKYFSHERIGVEAAKFLNDFFYFKSKEFPDFFFVECENITGKSSGEIVIMSESLDIIWGLGQRKIIHHISHFVKAAISDFSDFLKFREVVVENFNSSLTKTRGINDISADEIIGRLSLETSRKMMSNLFDDLSLGKSVLLGKDIFPLFGVDKSRKEVFPNIIESLQECMKYFDLNIRCFYYGRVSDDDGEEIDFENLVEHFADGEDIYDMECGKLIEDFNFDKLGLSVYKKENPR